MGAVHDFAALMISMRHKGYSIATISGGIINNRVKYLFFLIIFLALLIVIAIFGLVIALIFARFPSSVIAVWAEIPIAVIFGYAILKRKNNASYGSLDTYFTWICLYCVCITCWAFVAAQRFFKCMATLYCIGIIFDRDINYRYE